jgi:lauroyl/myristoyl acyltransferase
MDAILYLLVRFLIILVQAMPLTLAARVGRAGGALAYVLDFRHRRVARENLALCFGDEMFQEQITGIAKENFRRIGENFACAIKTSAMNWEEVKKHVEFGSLEKLGLKDAPHESRVIAIGHLGNFELYARFGEWVPGFVTATTYRGLRQRSLNKIMQSLREKSGCLFFERRTEGAELRKVMREQSVILGLLADQHAGDKGLRLPFLGHECSTSPAPAIFALRYKYRLYTGYCFRVGLARWRIEAGDEIPTHENNLPRAVEDITRDINAAFEAAVRRDPANWFWVHKRWKPKPKPRRQGATAVLAGRC